MRVGVAQGTEAGDVQEENGAYISINRGTSNWLREKEKKYGRRERVSKYSCTISSIRVRVTEEKEARNI